jgi:hypothetical protein
VRGASWGRRVEKGRELRILACLGPLFLMNECVCADAPSGFGESGGKYLSLKCPAT